MKFLKIALVVVLFPLLAASTDHKFYVSTTNVEYASEEQSIQIITKIFVDDLEAVLKERYNVEVSLDSPKETEADLALLKKYIQQKLTFEVNGKAATYSYLGQEYDTDIVKCYLEIPNISALNSIHIENKVLMDMYPEQQNIIHLKTPKSRRSIVLDVDNPKGVLNFN